MSDMSDRPPANDQDLDVEGFAAKHGISTDEARSLIDEVGHDTSALDAAAQKMKLER